jgi:hypothetical protein
MALTAAAITAAVIVLLCGYGQNRRPAVAAAGAVLGVALGFLAACVVLHLRPHWPPREDQDRLLLILLPTVVVVELLATAIGKWAWLVRVGVAAGAAWVLLFGSVYLTDLAGPASREWTQKQAILILTAMAGTLIVAWAALTNLARRAAGWTVPLALALTCGGAGVAVMLSGYASGGQLGIPFGGAIAGVVLPSLLLARPLHVTGVTGVAIVGLFALLVIGRFFGQLATGHALVLFLAPLACCLPELALVRCLGPRLRGLSRLLLAAIAVGVIVALAQQKFAESTQPTTASDEGSRDDYLNCGK